MAEGLRLQPLLIYCSYCHAAPAEECRTNKGERAIVSHSARASAALQAALRERWATLD